MPKRKASTVKSGSAKVSKKDNVITSDTEGKTDNETKLEEFKKKFGMGQGDDSDEKNWISGDSYLIYNPSDFAASSKIASFDIDGTLIDTKSGKKFAKTWDDFKIMLSEIPNKLKSLKDDGFKLVLFTNQAGFESGYVKEKDFKKKMKSLLEKLGVTMQIFIATDKSVVYRKPNTGLFEMLENKYNSDVKIDLADSFYVGDAAGRPDEWAPKKKKDFSCSDRLFAINCGLKFHTPEEFFLNEKPAPYVLPEFKPADVCDNSTKMLITSTKLKQTTSLLSDILPPDSSEPVLILMVGSPGAGKSHFCKEHLTPLGYNIINRDTLKTWQKCVAETERLLKEKKSVVIDNTNPDKATRERYVSCALSAGINHVLCFDLDVSYDHSRHNSKYRELTDDKHDKVSEMVFRIHSSKYQMPSLDEKFTDICKIVPGLRFESEEKEKLFRKYLNDK